MARRRSCDEFMFIRFANSIGDQKSRLLAYYDCRMSNWTSQGHEQEDQGASGVSDKAINSPESIR